MAVVTIHGSGERIEDDEKIRAFLDQYRIDYGQWDISSIPPSLLEKPSLEPDEKQQILDSLDERIEAEKQKVGYQSADVVTLSPSVPNLEKILEPFQKEHFHTENEIRFVVDGAGVFSINPRTAPAFDVAMVPGDFISVPAGTWHWFNLGAERRIKAVRIFESAEGWAAFYDEAAAARA
jgi:1,2-dihydroxy-3-keto-5-methylthiopentene dioxygenase